MARTSKLKSVSGPDSLGTISRNAIFLTGEKFLRLVVTFFSTVAVARALGPQDYGRFSYLLAWISLSFPFASLGLNYLLSREIVKAPGESGSILLTATVLRGVASLVVTALGVGIFAGANSNSVDSIVLLLVLYGFSLFRIFETLDFYFQGMSKSGVMTLAKSTGVLVANGLKLIFAWRGLGIAAFVIAHGIEWLVSDLMLVGLYFRSHHAGQAKFDSERGKRFFVEGLPLLFSGVAAIIYLKIDIFMIRAYLGDTATGIYSVAAKISEVWYAIPAAAAAALFPRLIRLRKENNGKYQHRLQQVTDGFFAAALLVAVTMQFVGSWFIEVFFGPEYADSASVLKLHIWAGVFYFMRAVFSKWILIEGKTIFSFISQVSGAVVNVILNVILIPTHGIMGAAIATVVSYSIASYVILFASKQTRPMAIVMSKAILSPLRYPLWLFNRKKSW